MPTPWRWREQLSFSLVLALVAAGFVVLLTSPGSWRLGTALVAIAVIAAGVLRLVLPTARAGMLAVRARGIDVLLYLLAGGFVLVIDLRLRG